MTRRTFMVSAAALGLTTLGTIAALKHSKSDARRIGVFLWAQNEVLAEMLRGTREVLDSAAASAGVPLDFAQKCADGDSATAAQIAAHFSMTGVQAVIAYGLLAIQSLKASAYAGPVIFAGLPDPIGTGLVSSLKQHNSRFTGTVYFPPIDLILDVFASAHPQMKAIGVLHNPMELSSMAVTRAFFSRARERGYRAEDLGATSGAELQALLRSISGRSVDAVFIPTDNLMHANLDLIMSELRQQRLPAFNCTKQSVEKGAEFSVATDYFTIGRETGRIAKQVVIDGVPAERTDIFEVHDGHLYIKSGSNITVPPGQKGYDVVVVP